MEVGIGFEVTEEEVKLVMEHREKKAREERLTKIAEEIENLIAEVRALGAYVQVCRAQHCKKRVFSESGEGILPSVKASCGGITFTCS